MFLFCAWKQTAKLTKRWNNKKREAPFYRVPRTCSGQRNCEGILEEIFFNTLVFGIKILDVHGLPFFSQHIIITVNFFNDCDFHVMDTMPLLVEMPTTCLLHLFLFDIVSMFWETSLEGPFTLTNILIIAFWTSDAVNDIFCLTISHKIDFLNKISFWQLFLQQ